MNLSSISSVRNPIEPTTGIDSSRHSERLIRRAEVIDASQTAPPENNEEAGELKEAFTEFVGQTLFGSMLASMRKTVGKPAYMHGGRTEEVFQKQLDQRIVEDLTDASAESIAQPMFELFTLQRR